MKFAVGSLITWRPLRRCGDSKLCRFMTYQGFRCLNHSISTDIPAKKAGKMESTGINMYLFLNWTWICNWLTWNTYFKDLDSFSHLLNNIKDERFWDNFWGEGLQVHQHKPGGTKVPTRGMAPAEVQVGKASCPIWNEKDWLVVNGWGKILRSQVVWWLECNTMIWYMMFRLFRGYNFVKHEISFYPKGQNSTVLSSLVWWRTHTDLQNTDRETWKNISCIEK